MDMIKILENIEKANDYISKKEALVDKRLNQIKKTSDPNKIADLEDSIANTRIQIQMKRDALQKHYSALEKEKQKAAKIENMPEPFKVLYNDTIATWDAHDINCRERYDEFYQKRKNTIEEQTKIAIETGDWEQFHQSYYLATKEFSEQTKDIYVYAYMSDAEIHTKNVIAGQKLILNLYDRVVYITGQITDGEQLTTSYNNQGFTIINGIVIGEKGKARITSIGAGGYNIQRWHIRVLVKRC